MNFRPSLRFFAAALLAASSALPAWAAETPALAAEVMELCGINRSLAEIGPQVELQIVQMPKQLPDNEHQALLAAMRSSFTGKAVAAHVAPQIAAMTPEELRSVRDWCGSTLGRKITAEEQRSSSPEAQAALGGFIEALKTKPAKPSRMAIIERIEKASAVVPVAIAMIDGVGTGVATGANAALPAEQRRSAEAIENDFARSRAGLKAVITPLMRGVLLFTYQRLSDKELERYAHMMESAAGRALSAAFSSGYIAGMSEAARNVGIDIVRRLNPKGA